MYVPFSLTDSDTAPMTASGLLLAAAKLTLSTMYYSTA